MLRRVLILALLFAAPLVADKKPKGVPMAKHADQVAAIADLILPDAAQKCTNYAWAVAVETMLKLQNVSLDQHFWVQKANGGELCIDPLPDMERLTKTLNGTYVLNDGRKVTLDTHVILGAPTIPDDALAPLKHGIPVLILLNSRALVLQSAIYDEFVYPNDQRMYIVRELKMLDPLAPPKQREVSFVNGIDDPAGISALLYVTVTPVGITQWQPLTKW